MADETLLLHGGTVHTLDYSLSTYDVIRFEDELVAAVGDDLSTDHSGTVETVDLDGRTVLSGFNDAHTHVITVGSTGAPTASTGAPTATSEER